MQPERIQELFEKMRETNRGVDTFIMSALLNGMIGRSLEAVIPVLERAHGLLSGDSEPTYLTGGYLATAVECPDGPHGGIWRKAIAISGPVGILVSVLEVDGEPNPKLDDVIDAMIEERTGTKRTAPRLSQPGPCREIRVYHVQDWSAIPGLLSQDAADGQTWQPELIISCQNTFPPYETGAPWKEFLRDVVRRDGIERWPSFFTGIGHLFSATGLTSAMAKSASEVSARNWERISGFDQYEGAALFGTEAALEDGYLPGARCMAALNSLDTLSAEAEMPEIAADLAKLSSLLDANPWLVEDGCYSANDGRTKAFPRTEDDNHFVMDLEDQNNRFSIVVRRAETTEVLVSATRRGSSVKCLDLSFKADADDQFVMTGKIGQDANAIRSWNSLVSMPESLVVCAEEDVECGRPGSEFSV